MNPRRTLAVVSWGALLAMAIAIPSNDRRFSVEIWFTVFCIWILGTMSIRLLFVTPVMSTSHIGLWRWLRRLTPGRDLDVEYSLLGPRSNQSLLQRASASERAHSRYLRPRLQTLADYYLPIHHGANPRNPGQVRAALGDVAWMVDDSVNNRRPTPAEIDLFLSVLVDDAVVDDPRPVGD